MSEWINSPLGEVAGIYSGGTPSRANASYWGGDVPWVTPSDITNCKTNYIEETEDSITSKGLTSSSAKLLPPGALLLTSRATIGEVKIAVKAMATNQGFKNLVPLSIDGKFLFYQCQMLKGQFIRFAAGSTFLEINRKDTARISIPHPTSPYTQRKIANVLETIDQAIEKTEALIDKYQKIKAGLMHDLFTRGIGPDGKLRPPREQAPELYQETPIGWIPKGWVVRPMKFGFSSNPKNGYSPKETDEWQGLYVLGLSCLTNDGFQPVQLKQAPAVAVQSGALLHDGDFLISRSNTQNLVGLCGIYRDLGYPAIYPDLIIKLKLNSNLKAEFLEKYLLWDATRLRISAIAVGTSGSMVKINAKSISALQIAFPVPEEQQLLTNKLSPIERQVSVTLRQLDKLRLQKAGLMKDLLTGKVKINPDLPE